MYAWFLCEFIFTILSNSIHICSANIQNRKCGRKRRDPVPPGSFSSLAIVKRCWQPSEPGRPLETAHKLCTAGPSPSCSQPLSPLPLPPVLTGRVTQVASRWCSSGPLSFLLQFQPASSSTPNKAWQSDCPVAPYSETARGR